MWNLYTFTNVLWDLYSFYCLNLNRNLFNLLNCSNISLIYYFLYYLLYYFLYLYNLFNYSWNWHYLFYNLFYFNHSGHFYQFFNNFLNNTWSRYELLPYSFIRYKFLLNNIPWNLLFNYMYLWFDNL